MIDMVNGFKDCYSGWISLHTWQLSSKVTIISKIRVYSLQSPIPLQPETYLHSKESIGACHQFINALLDTTIVSGDKEIST